MRNRRRLPGVFAFSVASIALVSGTTPARAQWGMGWGWGIFGVQPSASTNMVNQHALNRAAGMGNRPTSHRAYSSGGSNAYFNRVRDNGFVSHYDVRRRRAPSYQPERAASLGGSGRAEPRPDAPAASSPPAVPLAHFFDASMQLVWPSESPIGGNLKEKRAISDHAALTVYHEVKQHGSASISSVTEAREKLVDYGRPALLEIRAQATTVIADAFHRFLLSLYDALGDAAANLDAGP